jgi:citrate synthase
MSELLNILSEKIPVWRNEALDLIHEKGDAVISEVSVSHAYAGMRGIKSLICDTSSVSAETGLIIRGRPLLEIKHLLPEEVFFLLITGDIPSAEDLQDLQHQISQNNQVPDYVWNVLRSMPKNAHPMTMLDVAILALQGESKFKTKYSEGLRKQDQWKSYLEDGIALIAKIPVLAAGIYRMRFEKGDPIPPDNSLDWGANYGHMLGLSETDERIKKLMRLYLTLHCDHEGGNASTFTSLVVSSTLSDVYYSVSAGLNALAGPLHGRANQECLRFVLEIKNHFNSDPSTEELQEFCENWLKQGNVIPGYGHAVLRCPDPRFMGLIEFGEKNIQNDSVFYIVQELFKVVPEALSKQGKAKNPWPNVDAVSGSLLYHFGITEFNYYTVPFSVSRSLGLVAQTVLNRAFVLPLIRPKSITADWIKNNVDQDSHA